MNENNNGWEKQVVEGFWNPQEAGETLIGVVIEISTGLYGKTYTIENAEGTITTPSHKLLQALMANVQVGDKVKIVYKGMKPAKILGHNGTRVYEVFKKTTPVDNFKDL